MLKSSNHLRSWNVLLRPEGGGGGGGVKVDFPVFTYLIRAAEDEQEEKKTDRNLTLRF